MPPLLVRAVLALLLVVHGFAHWNITTLWGARPGSDSWALGPAASGMAAPLWMTSLLAFVLAGLAVLVFPFAWRPLAIVASAVSLVTIGLFFQPQMTLGALVDLGVLAGLVWLEWPSGDVLGT